MIKCEWEELLLSSAGGAGAEGCDVTIQQVSNNTTTCGRGVAVCRACVLVDGGHESVVGGGSRVEILKFFLLCYYSSSSSSKRVLHII